MTASDPVRAVVFDLGGVLIDWDPFEAVAAGVGRDEARRFLDEFDFPSWNHRLDAGRSIDDAEAEVAATYPRWLPHVRSYRTHFEDSLRGTHPETVELLSRLHSRAVPLYALTNWPAELFPPARVRFDFLALFTDIVVSGEVRLAKPDPRIFDVLRDRVPVPPERCLFVDDAPANVAAAGAAGLDAVTFTDAAALEAVLLDRGLLG
ncbi:MAG: HAD family hydrolase [Nocardioidaceae bacterium]